MFKPSLRLLSLLSVAASASLLSCQSKPGDTKSSGRSKDAKYSIAVIPKGTTHVFWQSVHYGAQQAAEEAGDVSIVWQGPIEENNSDKQIQTVQNFITKQVAGICLAPNDSTSLLEAVEQSKEKEIPVVLFDSGLDGDKSNYVTYVATDNRKGGKLAAMAMGKMLEGKGDVIVFRYKQGSESTNQREEGFIETIKTEFPEMNLLVTGEYIGTTPESSFDKARQILQKHRDTVDGVFAVCEPNANGTLQALKELDLEEQTVFIAFDPSEPLIEGLSDGSVEGIVLQDPVKMGYEAVKAMVAHLNGEKIDGRIDTGVYVATKENMNEEKIDELLHPPVLE